MTLNDQTALQRHELWRLQYRRRPYLTDASNSALSKRLEDIANNLITLTEEGKLGVLPAGNDGEPWMILFTHVLEEYESRGGVPESALAFATLPTPTAPDVPTAVVALRQNQAVNSSLVLVKLGKHDHMRELFAKGRIRIASAHSYSDPSLNFATKDNELSVELFRRGSEVQLHLLNEETGTPKQRIMPIGEVVHSIGLNSDYYVYCMTYALSYRLFDDFSANACVIIRDPMEFRTRLVEQVQRNLPNWVGWDQAVEYVDPYLQTDADIDLCFSKNVRFWYQHEYRFCWLPQGNIYTNLEPLFVEIDSLKDIAEFVTV